MTEHGHTGLTQDGLGGLLSSGASGGVARGLEQGECLRKSDDSASSDINEPHKVNLTLSAIQGPSSTTLLNALHTVF